MTYSPRKLMAPDDARMAYRQQQAIQFKREYLRAVTDLAALTELRFLMPSASQEYGGEAQQAAAAAPQLLRQAEEMSALAGFTDDNLPWKDFLAEFTQLLTVEEELYVRAEDQDAHPEAYGIDPGVAEYLLMRSECRCKAYSKMVDDIEEWAQKLEANSG